MKTKQSVTNSNNQPSTACKEKHAAIKLPITSTVIAAFGLLSMLLAVSETAQAQARDYVPPAVFQAAGPTAASIQSTVDAFRARLGDPNNLNNPGPLGPKGRREINWDGGNPNILDTTAPANPFVTFLNTRGSQFQTPGLGLSQAPPSGGPQGGLAVLFGNPTYGKIFRAFSLSRLFTPVGSNITEASFSIPGTNGLVPARVRGFGAVFTDVDQPDGVGAGVGGGSTQIQYFDRNGALIFTSFVPASPGRGSFSFFGIVFHDARIASVVIKTGDVAPGPNDDRRHDIVMMDDFIYGEPQLLE
ncbi:MAG TPA: hypothetical protein VMA33_06740 [Candidatus Tectomicrobia bacterium]|nr:hypothetical protein [Candidatus Tectomicrobia bacterium]